jgi:hypothetical protein
MDELWPASLVLAEYTQGPYPKQEHYIGKIGFIDRDILPQKWPGSAVLGLHFQFVD